MNDLLRANNAASQYSMAQFSPGVKVDPKSKVLANRITWAVRNRYNVIHNLSFERLTLLFNNFRIGYLRETALLYEALVERDSDIKSAISKRYARLSSHSFDFLPLDESPEAAQDADILRKFWMESQAIHVLEQDKKGDIYQIIEQLMHGFGHKYSVQEVIWRPPTDGNVPTALFSFCPTWMFEALGGKLRYLLWDFDIYGVDMAPENWLVSVGDGLMEATSVIYLMKSIALKDWVEYCARFGLPALVAYTEHNKGDAGWEEIKNLMSEIITGLAAVVKEGTRIEPVPLGAASANMPFPPLVEWCEMSIIKLWHGSDLGTKSRGSHAVGASLQQDETAALTRRDARLVEAPINNFSDHVVKYVTGRTRSKARFKFLVPEPIPVADDLAIDAQLAEMGVALDKAQALRRYNRVEGKNALQSPPSSKTDPIAQ